MDCTVTKGRTVLVIKSSKDWRLGNCKQLIRTTVMYANRLDMIWILDIRVIQLRTLRRCTKSLSLGPRLDRQLDWRLEGVDGRLDAAFQNGLPPVRVLLVQYSYRIYTLHPPLCPRISLDRRRAQAVPEPTLDRSPACALRLLGKPSSRKLLLLDETRTDKGEDLDDAAHDPDCGEGGGIGIESDVLEVEGEQADCGLGVENGVDDLQERSAERSEAHCHKGQEGSA